MQRWRPGSVRPDKVAKQKAEGTDAAARDVYGDFTRDANIWHRIDIQSQIPEQQLSTGVLPGAAVRRSDAVGPKPRWRLNVRDAPIFALHVLKFCLTLLLAGICTVGSMVCLLAIGLAAARLSAQAGTWLKTSQWDAFPLAALFHKFGYEPHVGWLWVQAGLERLMSLESVPIVIFLAGALWGGMVMLFDRVSKK